MTAAEIHTLTTREGSTFTFAFSPAELREALRLVRGLDVLLMIDQEADVFLVFLRMTGYQVGEGETETEALRDAEATIFNDSTKEQP